MSFSDIVIEKARKLNKKLVLAEGTEPRTQSAAVQIKQQGIAQEVFLVGEEAKIRATARTENLDLTGLTIIEPEKSHFFPEFVDEYYKLRQHKGISWELAQSSMKNNLNFGAMLLHLRQADAMLAGAESSTAAVLRAGLSIVQTAPGIKTASSYLVMELAEQNWGADGLLLFADCAIIPVPSSEQLADIALQTANSYAKYRESKPIVALLSFSTRGSAKHPNVDRVRDALEIAKKKSPNLQIDGEMQVDAAIVESVCAKKAPGSIIAGRANILIFPNLEAGNIAYKLVQRLANAGAYGPFLQGFSKPISDLSRGCSVSDIIITSAVTLAQ